MGCSYFLPRLVGTSIASELMLTSRFIHAHRALSTNLVSEVVADNQLEAAAQRYVDDMLATSPNGVEADQRRPQQAVDAAGLEVAMAIKNRNQLMCSRTEDVREGMMVFIDKRPTNYQGK